MKSIGQFQTKQNMEFTRSTAHELRRLIQAHLEDQNTTINFRDLERILLTSTSEGIIDSNYQKTQRTIW